jgi:hypothetical protein
VLATAEKCWKSEVIKSIIRFRRNLLKACVGRARLSVDVALIKLVQVKSNPLYSWMQRAFLNSTVSELNVDLDALL